MQKLIRNLTIIATALVATSLFLLLVTTPFQQAINTGFYRYRDINSILPVVPVIPFSICMLRFVCVALLIACCGNRKGGIWMELVIIGIMVMFLPTLHTVLNYGYNTFLMRKGADYVIANSLMSQISTYCLIPADLGIILAYVCCGMSIVFKRMSKKAERENREQISEEVLPTE